MNLSRFYGYSQNDVDEYSRGCMLLDHVEIYKKLYKKSISDSLINQIANGYNAEIREHLIWAGYFPDNNPVCSLYQFCDYLCSVYEFIMQATRYDFETARKIVYIDLTEKSTLVPCQVFAMCDILIEKEQTKIIPDNFSGNGSLKEIADKFIAPIREYFQIEANKVATSSLKSAIINNLPLILLIIISSAVLFYVATR